jgi:hypothetical protein
VSRLGLLDAVDRVVIGAGAAVLLVLVPGVPGPVRGVVAVAWFLVVPGLAWVRALPVDDPVERFAVVIGLSLALDVLAAEATVYVGLAGVFPAVVLLLAISALGLLLARPRAPVAT